MLKLLTDKNHPHLVLEVRAADKDSDRVRFTFGFAASHTYNKVFGKQRIRPFLFALIVCRGKRLVRLTTLGVRYIIEWVFLFLQASFLQPLFVVLVLLISVNCKLLDCGCQK